MTRTWPTAHSGPLMMPEPYTVTSGREWLPIADAPHDGTPVLIGRHGVKPAVAWWVDHEADNRPWSGWMCETRTPSFVPTHYQTIGEVP